VQRHEVRVAGGGCGAAAVLEWKKTMKSTIILFVGTAIVADILLKLDVAYPYFAVPIPNVIGPMFHLDGESHYNADLVEIWLEFWLALLVPVFAIRWVYRRISNLDTSMSS
jgi:hypothetical protein